MHEQAVDMLVPDSRPPASGDGDIVPHTGLADATTNHGVADTAIRAASILLVDDQPANLRLFTSVLSRDGYQHLLTATDPSQALQLFVTQRPSLVVLDLHMPGGDGFALLRRLCEQIGEREFLPILVVTADTTPSTKRRALAAGATDFLAKPLDPIEVRLRVEHHLRTRLLQDAVRRHNEQLEDRVRARTADLEAARLETLRSLALAAEFRDDDTGQHTQRVATLACDIARALGLMQSEVVMLGLAAPLHDVGKIAIPDHILLKPGKLTPEEFEVIKTHTTVGARILDGGSSTIQRLARAIALGHHERWDGAGYPRGLSGPAIPLACRIVAVADTFDVLTHERPYKPAWPASDAVAEIIRHRGAQFDPAVVDALLRVMGPDESGTA